MIPLDIKGLPIDLSRFVGRVVMLPPRPRVNGETGELRPDRDGKPVFLVGVALVKDGTNEAQVVDIQVTSELIGIEPGVVVELEGLEATPWAFEGRSGLSWKVSKITAVDGSQVKMGGSVDGAALKSAAATAVRKGSTNGGEA